MGDDFYFKPDRIMARLQNNIQDRADGVHKQWLASYYKVSENIVRGAKMQEIRFKVHQWQRQWETEQQTVPVELEREVAGMLLQQPWIDDQLAAIIFLSENLIPLKKITPLQVFSLYEPTFAEAYISNRLVCDNFASKVLVPLLNLEPNLANRLCQFWLPAPNLWQARAALAALSALAADAVHQEALLYGCSVLIRRPEGEAKSVAGTALRSLCKHRVEPVDEFLGVEETLAHFDALSLSKATTNFQDARRVKTLKDTRRRLLKTGLAAGTPSAALAPPVFAAGASSAFVGPSTAVSSGMGGVAAGSGYGLGIGSTDPLDVGMGMGQDVVLGEHVEEQQMGHEPEAVEAMGVSIGEAAEERERGMVEEEEEEAAEKVEEEAEEVIERDEEMAEDYEEEMDEEGHTPESSQGGYDDGGDDDGNGRTGG